MSFTPRLHTNGTICCSNPNNLCPKCAAHAVNPYARHMENRALTANDLQPSFDPNYKPHGQPADGYRIALAARKIR